MRQLAADNFFVSVLLVMLSLTLTCLSGALLAF
jgi:hypothetical protein